MRVQLYNPPVHHYSGVHYRMNPPLGLPILCAVLRDAGHSCEVMDLEALRVSPDELGEVYGRDESRWPDAVGFTVTTHNQRGTRESIAALRDVGYEGYILLGGPHVTLKPTLGVGSWGADVWVTGECEGNIARIVEEQPRGLVQGETLEIDTIPTPAWDAHYPKPTGYGGNLPKIGHPEGIAMWSRGCPHGCWFCGNPVFGHKRVRRRSPERVYEDMAALVGMGVESVFVYDDELPGMPGGDEWLMEVCEAIAPLKVTWKCQGRCTRKLDRAVLEAMHDAGCRAVMWGVESLSQPVLDAMHKGITVEDVEHTLATAHAAGIGNWVFLMVANYGETVEGLAETEARLGHMVRAGLVQWRQVTVCTPVPGTPLYEAAKAEGWLVEPPEAGPQMAQVYQSTPWLTREEIAAWKRRLEVAG